MPDEPAMSEPYRAPDADADAVDESERERLDADLRRLAREGAERRTSVETAAYADRKKAGHRNLRIAVGAYRGSALKRNLAVAVTGAGLVGTVVMIIVFEPKMSAAVILIALTLLLSVLLTMPPLASKEAIAAEEQWVAALPFRLEGYFEVLSGEPSVYRIVVYDLSWSGEDWAHAALLEDVVAAVDPKATVEPFADGRARVVSGPISGWTNIKRGKTSYVTRNHRIPAAVHAMVDVLVSLHRRYPLARVSLTSR